MIHAQSYIYARAQSAAIIRISAYDTRTSCTNKCSNLQYEYNVIYAECMTGNTSMACGVMVFVDGLENQHQVHLEQVWKHRRCTCLEKKTVRGAKLGLR